MILEKTILSELLRLQTYREQADVLSELNLDLFTDPINRNFLEICAKVLFSQKKAIDEIVIYSEAAEGKGVSPIYLSELQTLAVDASKIWTHIQQIKERTYANKVKSVIGSSLKEIKETASFTEFEEKKNDLIINLSGMDLETESQFVKPYPIIELIEENIQKKKQLEGHSWGLTDLDNYTSGIVTPRLIVVGGLKKTGKSRFIINTMIELYHNNVPSFFLSLEMPEYEVVKLLISRFSGVPEPKLRNGALISNDEKVKFEYAKKNINWDLLNIECIGNLSLNQTMNRVRRYSRMQKESVLFIDYLQRIQHDRSRQAQELEKISIAIADSTREFGIPIILLSQLSNAAERDGASIGTLKGSGAIGEAADVILLLDSLYRRNKADENKNKMDCYIEQRYGDSGKIELETDLSWCKFADRTYFPRFDEPPI